MRVLCSRANTFVSVRKHDHLLLKTHSPSPTNAFHAYTLLWGKGIRSNVQAYLLEHANISVTCLHNSLHLSGIVYAHVFIHVCVHGFVNPWRACAARVTVLNLCVCVCLLALILALRATRGPKSGTNGFSATLA